MFLVILLLLFPATLIAQGEASPTFEVASIRLAPDAMQVNVRFVSAMASIPTIWHGRLDIPGFPLKWLIMFGYKVREFQVLGGPSWVSSDRYQVTAKANGGASFKQMQVMLQALLTDRFKLALRREEKQLPIYELKAVKRGLKIEAAKDGSCGELDRASPPPPRPDLSHPPAHPNVCGGTWILNTGPGHRTRFEGVAVTMSRLIEMLSEEVGRTVVDKTGFGEKFDFQVEFEPSDISGDPRTQPADSNAVVSTNVSGISIFDALQRQLGLRLESAKGPVEVLVIDHVERPSEN